jgi:hypothetical protein
MLSKRVSMIEAQEPLGSKFGSAIGQRNFSIGDWAIR